jgi:steroid delta-isomerase-like uncharacterized protein
MTAEENKRLIQRWLPAWNERNMEAFYDIFDPACDFRSLAAYGLPPTLENFKLITGSMIQSFPDIQNRLEEIIAEDDKVVVRVSESGTHRGTWLNIPATNKQVTFQEWVVYRFGPNGKVVEWTFLADMLGILNQINPAPAR